MGIRTEEARPCHSLNRLEPYAVVVNDGGEHPSSRLWRLKLINSPSCIAHCAVRVSATALGPQLGRSARLFCWSRSWATVGIVLLAGNVFLVKRKVNWGTVRNLDSRPVSELDYNLTFLPNLFPVQAYVQSTICWYWHL
jgi:hypothetical protein